jgi:phosphatidate cytidylyltransferase
MKIGKFVVLVPFAVAFINDAGAYFAGLYFGKHKLAPVLSPNKTIEGVIGGIIASVFSMVLYAVILQLADFRVSYGLAVLYGLLGAIAGAFGDLCFSVIKRQTGIKDYGKLMPGHGGILDRFDSMMTVAPLMEILLLWIPFAEG